MTPPPDNSAALTPIEAAELVASDQFPPGPRGIFGVLRTLRAFRSDPLGLLDRLRADYGDIAGVRVAKHRFVIVSEPAYARHMLADNADNYVKGWTYDPLRDVLGNGLLTSDGAQWKRSRKLIQPAFHRKTLSDLVPTMSSCADRIARRWDEIADIGQPIDVVSHMTDLALDVSTRTLLATGFSEHERAEIMDAVHQAVKEANRKLTQPIRYTLPFPTFAKRRLRRIIARLNEVIYGVIDRRMADPGEHTDLLAMIMCATDAETGESLTREQLRDELITLFIAGYESTSVALSWMWYHLDQNPQARETLERELDTVEDDDLSFDSVFKLRYAHAVAKESMRVMAPAWLFGQHAIEDDYIGGYRIPAGAIVMVSPYLLHRNERYWANATEFDPNRWLTENRDTSRPKYAYLPFSGGQRTCIGNHFAVMEMIVALVELASRFRVEIDPEHPVVPEPLSTVGFLHGLRARISRRPAAL